MDCYRTAQLALLGVALFAAPVLLAAQEPQRADTVFDRTVIRPAYSRGAGPVVAVDEAHNNFHTISNRYRPFAEVLLADGYRVVANKSAFNEASLRGVDVLVIANAAGGTTLATASADAFPVAERDALYTWVENGGHLLLIADHEPMGDASRALAKRFDVDMSTGRTFDDPHSDWTSGSASWLVFQRDTGAILGKHPITQGRDSTERIRRVVTFTGQSLMGPAGSVALLPLATGAFDMFPDRRVVLAVGRSQGVAFAVGKGRVVVLGEASFLTAQIASAPGLGERRFGFTWPNNDDRQFLINTVHWLSGVLK